MLPELTTSAPLTPLTYARRAEPAELPELMDQPSSYEDLRACLRDLAEVNRVTRGYKPTLAFLDRIAGSCDSGVCHLVRNPSRPLRILDVGSGGGDTLELTGVDLNPHCTRAALEFSAKDPLAANIQWRTADIFAYTPDPEPDLVLSALFTHHLSSPEVVRFLSWMEQHAHLGWFINDLHRSRNAAFFFRILPVLFGWHHFVAHDGPVSLRRSFVPEDWERMLAQAHITGATIEQHSMNRLCVSRLR
jgi:SAM-dependent methyltransferase